jgi:hypothetical protein
MDLRKIFVFTLFIMSVSLFSQEVKTARVIGGPSSFEIGKKYKILHYRANVRAEPSINGNIIAILSLNDDIEILEYSNIEEMINGTHGFWVKIKYGNIIGYTFSGNIAMRSLVTKLAIVDADDTITDDVFVSLHFQKSMFYSDEIFLGWLFGENIENELFIYINGRKINTSNINKIPGPLDNIEFEQGRISILIYFIAYAREGTRKYTYRLSNSGIIDFIGEYGDWYPDWYIGSYDDL